MHFPTAVLDYPLLRASCVCPLCSTPKARGLVVCWPCFNKYGLRMGNPTVDQRLDELERELGGRKVA